MHLSVPRPTFATASLRAVAAATSLFTAACSGNGSTGSTATAAPSAAASGDARLRPVDVNGLAALTRGGADRRCGHDIENEIRVPRTADGDAIAASLPSATYFVRVAQNASGSGSLVIVEQHLVPTDDAIVAMVAKMQSIAAAHHGTYDRWETQPVKSC